MSTSYMNFVVDRNEGSSTGLEIHPLNPLRSAPPEKSLISCSLNSPLGKGRPERLNNPQLSRPCTLCSGSLCGKVEAGIRPPRSAN
jgi:hypothetical protein